MSGLGERRPVTTVRSAVAGDLVDFKSIIDGNELFPSDMLDDMMSAYLGGSATGDHWVAGEVGSQLAGVGYFVPERMTEGAWNLLLIAVEPRLQGLGIGAAIMAHAEQTVIASGGRLLLVETSGLPEFEKTRGFYRRIEYVEEARIRNFYQAGEDKVVFVKTLAPTIN